MILTEHLLTAGRRPQTSKKGKKPPHNWVGQKEKRERERKEKNESGLEQHFWELWKKKEICILGGPLTEGRSAGREGEPQSLREKNHHRYEEGKAETELHIIGITAWLTPAWDTLARTGHWGSGTGGQSWEKSCVICVETALGG